MNTTYYRFFDTILSFQTNSEEISREFQRIYGWFKDSTKASVDINCSIVKNNNSYSILAKSKRYSAEYTLKGKLHSDVYLSMFSPVIYEVKDYFLIHAGSLAVRDTEGLIVSAPCGFGKTTLTLELIKQGFGFLSDELAPINRNTGLIHPYPRGIGVLTEKDKKIMTPVKNIDTPCKPACVIFITLQKEEAGGDTRYLELTLARFSENIYKQLKQQSEIKEVTIIENRLFPMLRLKVLKEAYIVPKIQEICDQNQVPIIYTLKGKTYPPDFNAVPKLEQMPVKEGVFQLSQNILNAHNSALIEDVFSGSRSRMIFELAGLMNNVKFYTLTVGKLKDMVNLVKELCRKKS